MWFDMNVCNRVEQKQKYNVYTKNRDTNKF